LELFFKPISPMITAMKILTKKLKMMVFALSTGLLFVGCAKQGMDDSQAGDAEMSGPVEEASPYDLFMQKVSSLDMNTQTNELVQAYQEALKNDALADSHGMIYGDLIRIYFSQGRQDEAMASFEAVLNENKQELLSQGLNVFLSEYAVFTDAETFQAYCDKLLTKDLSDFGKTTVWRALAWSYLQASQLDRFSERLEEFERSIDPTNYAQIFGMVLGQAIRAQQYEATAALLDKIKSREAFTSRPDVAAVLLRQQAELFLARDQLAEAEAFLTEQVSQFNDPTFSALLVPLLSKAHTQGDEEMVKRLSVFTFKLKDKPRSRNQAALTWARQPAQPDKPDYRLFLERVGLLITSGIDPLPTFRLYQRYYYNIMKNSSPELRSLCVDIGIQVSTLDVPWEEVDQNMMQLLLDGTFYMRDFNKSLEILNAGIPGKTPEWHQMLINKVSAHIAEEEGRYDEAIERYRKHMESIRDMDDLANPETQRIVIPESVLAFNEKRIGDLYMKSGNKKAANEAYGRARKLYKQALEIAEEGSPDALEIEQELENVPLNDS
jgi:tetratricopeptide (TPR) repeat protein